MTSGGNIFSDFPENKLAIDFAFLCKPTWWNATLCWCHLGERRVSRASLDYTTGHCSSRTISGCLNMKTHFLTLWRRPRLAKFDKSNPVSENKHSKNVICRQIQCSLLANKSRSVKLTAMSEFWSKARQQQFVQIWPKTQRKSTLSIAEISFAELLNL